MSDLRPKPHLVVNATELRTGSAFRFGTKQSGSWRWGKLHQNDVSVAHAVAASAAYPLFLPAFDETFMFDDKGTLRTERVVLTDGGIYDNLGLGCLWPDRSPDVSLNVTPVDTIICCSAGYGLRQEPPSQFLLARMSSVFSALFERASSNFAGAQGVTCSIPSGINRDGSSSLSRASVSLVGFGLDNMDLKGRLRD